MAPSRKTQRAFQNQESPDFRGQNDSVGSDMGYPANTNHTTDSKEAPKETPKEAPPALETYFIENQQLATRMICNAATGHACHRQYIYDADGGIHCKRTLYRHNALSAITYSHETKAHKHKDKLDVVCDSQGSITTMRYACDLGSMGVLWYYRFLRKVDRFKAALGFVTTPPARSPEDAARYMAQQLNIVPKGL